MLAKGLYHSVCKTATCRGVVGIGGLGMESPHIMEQIIYVEYTSGNLELCFPHRSTHKGNGSTTKGCCVYFSNVLYFLSFNQATFGQYLRDTVTIHNIYSTLKQSHRGVIVHDVHHMNHAPFLILSKRKWTFPLTFADLLQSFRLIHRPISHFVGDIK